MGKTEIEAFLSHLATNRKVAASTQRQALKALVFLYRHVLDKPIGDNIAPVKAKKRRRPPCGNHKDRSPPCQPENSISRALGPQLNRRSKAERSGIKSPHNCG